MKNLLFVSVRFLFPADSGGKIRTAQILRGLKEQGVNIHLVCPQPTEPLTQYSEDLKSICDSIETWQLTRRSLLEDMCLVFRDIPVSVARDESAQACRMITEAWLTGNYDVVVFDFPHAHVVNELPPQANTVIFTHNVESEIYLRHTNVARNPVKKLVWRNQYRKMYSFEANALRAYSKVVAVSDRDAAFFRKHIGVDAEVITTGVDTDFYVHASPSGEKRVVFTGSMDWMANVDAIEYFIDEMWPRIVSQEPSAKLLVIGRNPPSHLLRRAEASKGSIEFTGFVDDVRPYASGADAYIIPLRVGGGTRIKVFEAMSMGVPVVSTGIGVEGLGLQPDEYYLAADEAEQFAESVVRLLRDPDKRSTLSHSARDYVTNNFSFRRSVREFLDICSASMTAAA